MLRHADGSCLLWDHAEAPATTAGAQIIDGKLTSELIRKEIALEAAAVKSKYGKAWSSHLPMPAPCTILAYSLQTSSKLVHHVMVGALFKSMDWESTMQRDAQRARDPFGVQAPGLAVVLVGSRGDSATYVRSKKKACADVGIESFGAELPEDVSEEDLLKVQNLCCLTRSLDWEAR